MSIHRVGSVALCDTCRIAYESFVQGATRDLLASTVETETEGRKIYTCVGIVSALPTSSAAKADADPWSNLRRSVRDPQSLSKAQFFIRLFAGIPSFLWSPRPFYAAGSYFHILAMQSPLPLAK